MQPPRRISTRNSLTVGVIEGYLAAHEGLASDGECLLPHELATACSQPWGLLL